MFEPSQHFLKEAIVISRNCGISRLFDGASKHIPNVVNASRYVAQKCNLKASFSKERCEGRGQVNHEKCNNYLFGQHGTIGLP